MGRELRKVPAGWEHPKRNDGSYQPMFNEYYGNVLKEWFEENEKWENGSHPAFISNPEYKKEYPFYAQYERFPDIEYYQTKKYTEDELTHIQLYETTSEGKPISPVFHKDDFDKLCEWAAENATTFANFKASKEKWKEMLLDDFVYHS
jgi:hypothetical protein